MSVREMDVRDVGPLEIAPLTGAIGAEITGIDLGRPLDAEVVDLLQRALAEHGVVFLPWRPGDIEAHLTLARALGEINPPHALLASLKDQGHPEIGLITTEVGNNRAANEWHSDVTWMAAPSKYSILHMQVGPAVGGDTLWCSQVAAYEALSPAMQAFLEPLTAHHRISDQAPDMCADHPVVIRHPLTGRKALFVNRLFTTRINELNPRESADLLDTLIAHATRPDFTVRKRWRPGDFGIWDNHFVQHYAVLDYGEATRTIHRIEIVGAPPIPASAAAAA